MRKSERNMLKFIEYFLRRHKSPDSDRCSPQINHGELLSNFDERFKCLEDKFSEFTDSYYRQFGEHQHLLANSILGAGTALMAGNRHQEAVNFLRLAMAVDSQN